MQQVVLQGRPAAELGEAERAWAAAWVDLPVVAEEQRGQVTAAFLSELERIHRASARPDLAREAVALSGWAADALARRGRLRQALAVLRSITEPETDAARAMVDSLEPSALWSVRLFEVQLLRADAAWTRALRALASLEREVAASGVSQSAQASVTAGIHVEAALVAVELGRIDEALREIDAIRSAARDVQPPELARALLAEALFVEADARGMLEQFSTIVELIDGNLDALGAAAPTRRALIDLQRANAVAQLVRRGDSRLDEALQGLDAAAASRELALESRIKALALAAEIALDVGLVAEANKRLSQARALLAEEQAELSKPGGAELAAVEARAEFAERDDADEPARRVALERLRSAYLGFLDDWAAVERPPGGLGFLQQASRRSVISELCAAELQVDPGDDGVLAAFEHVLRAQACGSLALRLGAPRASLRAVQGRLLADGDHGMVVFVPGADRLHVFALDRERLACSEVPHYRALRARIRVFLEVLTEATTGDASESSESRVRWLLEESAGLTAALVPPEVGTRLSSWSAVTFVGLDLLEGLPAEVLTFDREALLGETHAVDTLPSIPSGLAFERRVGTHSASEHLFLGAAGAPAVGPAVGLVRFELSQAEQASLTAAYDPERTRVLLDARVTPQALMTGGLDDFRVVHLFAHGVYDPRRVRGATLALASSDGGDGLFGCEEVERCSVGGLVILSACSAGLGPRRLGDDSLAHLGGAFLAAGARAVVLSRAKIELRSAVRGSTRLHARLAAGDSPAQAMRVARAAVASGPRDDPNERWRVARTQVLGLGQLPLFGD